MLFAREARQPSLKQELKVETRAIFAMTTYSIEMLPADHGDCFIVQSRSAGELFTMVIDGGTRATYGRGLRKRLQELAKVDAVVLTHVDYDHIGGFIAFFQDAMRPKPEIGCFYINTPSVIRVLDSSGKVSIDNGITLENLLRENGIKYQSLTSETKNIEIYPGISLDVLSPDKDALNKLIEGWECIEEGQKASTQVGSKSLDINMSIEELSRTPDKFKSIESDFVNATSIAFILNLGLKRILFLGDSHPQVVIRNIEKNPSLKDKIHFDYVKLSHHGSIHSISKKLIRFIVCSKFLLSTNGGGAKYHHPSRECLAKLVTWCDRGSSDKITFFTNYPAETMAAKVGTIFSQDELNDYKIHLEYRRMIEFDDN